MKILVLNGSPHPNGNTAAMVSSFVEGASENGHEITVVNVGQKKIAGCIACEYCHTDNRRVCIQQDDMQSIYPVLDQAEMIVLASPIYYYGFTGQLQCAINRIYALGKPKNLKKAALLLSSIDTYAFSGAIFEYQNAFLIHLKMEDMGIRMACGKQNKSEETLKELRDFGRSIK